MVSKKDCLELIAKTLLSAPDPESAYVLRARLHRSLLMVGRFIANDLSQPLPLMPDDLERLGVQDDDASRIVTMCNEVLAQSKSLCQPSESLEVRWKSGWNQVVVNLMLLEIALKRYKNG